MGTIGNRLQDFGEEARDRFEQMERRAGQRSQREGELTRRIERMTAALPSTTWLMLGGGALVASIGLELFGKHKAASFVASWAPPLLIIGLYNKLVKVVGSDREEHRRSS